MIRLLVLLFVIPLVAKSPTLTPVGLRLKVAISRIENCKRWNNPGCLKYAKQLGAKRGPNGYAVFKTKELGERALVFQIQRYSGSTVRGFLVKYNPGVKGYVKKILAASGGLKDTDIL